MTAWYFETFLSLRQMVLSGRRPTETDGPATSTLCDLCPGWLTISFADNITEAIA